MMLSQAMRSSPTCNATGGATALERAALARLAFAVGLGEQHLARLVGARPVVAGKVDGEQRPVRRRQSLSTASALIVLDRAPLVLSLSR